MNVIISISILNIIAKVAEILNNSNDSDRDIIRKRLKSKKRGQTLTPLSMIQQYIVT